MRERVTEWDYIASVYVYKRMDVHDEEKDGYLSLKKEKNHYNKAIIKLKR